MATSSRRSSNPDRRAQQDEGEGEEGQGGLRLHRQGEGATVSGEVCLSNETKRGGAKHASDVHQNRFNLNIFTDEDQTARVLLFRLRTLEIPFCELCLQPLFTTFVCNISPSELKLPTYEAASRFLNSSSTALSQKPLTRCITNDY